MESARTRTAVRLMRLIPREHITRALGRLANMRVPRPILDPVLRAYTRAYHVDLGEAELPPSGFRTFNEFFTRRLREGLRPIDPDPDVIVSPADGRLDDAGEISPERTFLVKGQRYDASTLLANEADAAAFAGGVFAVIYLSPRDYHRVHSPVDGTVIKVRHIPGTLYPVNAFGVRHVPQLFVRNERVATILRTERFGNVAVVMVGAMIVGRIRVTFDAPVRPHIRGDVSERCFAEGECPRLARGDELGAFDLGSTVVLLVGRPERGRYIFPDGIVGTHVRVGQAITRRSDA